MFDGTRTEQRTIVILSLMLLLVNAVLINVGFLVSFYIRYGLPFPEHNFSPFLRSHIFLTLIYISALFFLKVYKKRFRSSWDLFKRVLSGLFFGTLLSIAFLYVSRVKWGAFPTSVFAIAFFTNLLVIFKLNQLVLKIQKRIRKKVVVIGRNNVDDMLITKAHVQTERIDEIQELIHRNDLDEVIICKPIEDEKIFNLLIFLIQRSKVDVVFAPSVYLKLLPEKINGNSSISHLSTFIGRKRDIDEFLMRSLDFTGSFALLLLAGPLIAVIALWIRLTSGSPVVYKQQRVGKDGVSFTLYKFRTMVNNAEQKVGPVLAKPNDHRVTKGGKFLRTTRLDELPQLFNVLKGDMSMVGPRPERPHFVKIHKSLRELRLAVRPGITGLAQIRSFYDLKPRHKIRYDYLYIQRRSLQLNLYILAKTIPVVLSKKGW